MSWIVTADGDELDMDNPRPGHITINSIGHSLAQINRFNGHADRPYSVAEHSLLVVDIMRCVYGIRRPEELLAGLLHDAHEAFCGDMHSPGKWTIGAPWRKWESHWERNTHRAFALGEYTADFAKLIKRADLIALATEKRDLLPARATTSWEVLDGVEPASWVDLTSAPLACLYWRDWRDAFISMYDKLDHARNQQAGLSITKTGA